MTREEAIEKVREMKLSPGKDAELIIALHTLIPELRESEDERIRKAIVGLIEELQRSDKYFAGVELADMLAYLEKQKEHQNNSDAPNESSWSGMISSSDKDKNLDEIAQDYVDGVKEYNPEPTWDLMQTAVCYGYHYREQKEQKPREIEWEDAETLAYIRDILKKYFLRSEEFEDIDRWLTEHYIEQKPLSPDEKMNHSLFLEGFDVGREVGKVEAKQKPTDYPYLPGWRKNRDDNKPELKRSVLMLTTHGVVEGEWLGEKWCQYRWSCELKDGEVLYWMHLSDLEQLEKEGEEKQKEQKPIEIAPNQFDGITYGMHGHSTDKTADGFKEARGKYQVEWSEEDENKIKDIIEYLECWNDFDHGSESFEEYRKRMEGNIQFMKSLRPSWKPSEEQMEHLQRAINYYESDWGENKLLRNLINDLKKLM